MKKGQAAIEFLTTYGLSFMILIVVIGGLAYFGVFDRNNFVPSSCSIQGTLGCPIYALESSSTNFALNIELVNAGGERITIENISIKDKDYDEYCFSNTANDNVGAPIDANYRILTSSQGKTFSFEYVDGAAGCTFLNSFSDTLKKRNYDIRIYYTPKDATQQVSLKGTIISTAQPWS